MAGHRLRRTVAVRHVDAQSPQSLDGHGATATDLRVQARPAVVVGDRLGASGGGAPPIEPGRVGVHDDRALDAS